MPLPVSPFSSITVQLAGIACIMLGALIITFDYPQIAYLGGLGHPKTSGDVQQDAMYGRLVTEFFIGVSILTAGLAMCMPRAIHAVRQRL